MGGATFDPSRQKSPAEIMAELEQDIDALQQRRKSMSGRLLGIFNGKEKALREELEFNQHKLDEMRHLTMMNEQEEMAKKQAEFHQHQKKMAEAAETITVRNPVKLMRPIQLKLPAQMP